MGKLIVPVGLPASGKSTLARELAEKENAIIISSDLLREELYGDINDQSHNTAVFEEMNRRTNQYINEGKNVIYDATNLSRKRRMHLINQIAKNADEKIAIYISVSLQLAILRDGYRNRTVGDGVIKKMYKNVQIPLIGEGWTDVRYNFQGNAFTKLPLAETREDIEKFILSGPDHDKLFDYLAENVTIHFDEIFNLPHDSSYHKFSVSRHTYWVYRWILDNYSVGTDKMMLLWAALFHDIGKAHCKSFINYKGEEQKHANFIGHEHVSSQLAFQCLTSLGYHRDFVEDTCTVIQLHMMLYNDGGLANARKLLRTTRLTDRLLMLNTADRAAH